MIARFEDSRKPKENMVQFWRVGFQEPAYTTELFLSYMMLSTNTVKKRSSLDIISTILEAANGGIGKTRLLEKANLTTSQFRKYVDLLTAKKLLAENNSAGHPLYKTTELGIQYVTLYSAIKSTLYLRA